MNLLLGIKFWDTVYNTFSSIFSGIGVAISNNLIISILTLAILVVLIVYRTIRNRFTTEVTTYKAINKINEYLAKNPFITEENLVEFNRLMMNAPKTLRFQWQRYIINRDKKPSDFMNEENCITRPLRTNSYKQGLNTFLFSSVALSLFSAFLMIAFHNVNADSAAGSILLSLVTPSISLFLSIIYMMFGNILYNAIMTDLYYSYSNFEKNIDRAVTTMPEAIDYEIIFTPKEIQNGIPALQEFLEQRALYDQEQLKKAKESEVEHETYNFDELGVDGSLVMQRALKESELYLGNRRRLLAEIETIQTEKSSVQKDFDEENKNYQRNLRDIREEISSIKSKIEVVTNEITRSSLRRQQSAEVEKEQNIEKEIEKATNKYNDRIAKLNAEIDKKRKEIDDSKLIAEKSLTDEFKHFSDKAYKDLRKVAESEVKQEVENLTEEKNNLELTLEEKDKMVAEKLSLYEDKVQNYDNLEAEVTENKNVINELKDQVSDLNRNVEDKDQEIFEIRQQLENRDKELLKKNEIIENYKKKKAIEIYRYFDADGNEFYYDDNNNPYYLDEEGNAVYFNEPVVEDNNVDANQEDTLALENENQENIEDENAENSTNDENTVEEVVDSESKSKKKNKKSRKNKKNKELEIIEENPEEPETLQPTEENVENDEHEETLETPSEEVNDIQTIEPEHTNEESEMTSGDEGEPSDEGPKVDDTFGIGNNDEEGYKGIQDTLNKLAKAAEEKMKQESAKNESQNNNRKKKSKKGKKNK